MKHERLWSMVVAAVLATCLAVGAVACMVTGLRLDGDLIVLGVCCALSAVATSIGFTYGRSGIVWAVAGAGWFFLSIAPDFLLQLKAMLNDIFRFYNQAYAFPIPAWFAGTRADSHLWPLIMIGSVVAVIVAWVVIRRKSAFPAVAAALLPVAACVVVTDTVPSVMALSIWLFGFSMLLVSSFSRRKSRQEGVRVAAVLALPLVLLLIGTMHLASREGTPDQRESLLEWIGQGLPDLNFAADGTPIFSVGSTTAEENVDLSAVGELSQPRTPVIEVTAPRSGRLYLRGRGYRHYDGKNWTADDGKEVLKVSGDRYSQKAGTVDIRVLRKRGQYYLPCYIGGNYKLEGGMLPNPDWDMEYSFDYRVLTENWRANSLREGYTQTPPYEETGLPEQTRLRAQAYLQTHIPQWQYLSMYGSVHFYEGVDAIADHVRGSAAYDLQTGRMPSSETDFAMWFLEESDTGYCTHFATAATVLLRAAGVPARYVTGYTVNVTAGETTIVREEHAHAWVEYFAPGVGWVILDPTPSGNSRPDATEPSTQPATEPSETTPTTQPTQPSEKPSEPSTGTKPSVPDAGPTAPDGNGGGSKNEGPPQWLGPALLWTAAIALLAAAVVGQWWLRIRLRRQRRQRGGVNAQALFRYRESARMAKLLDSQVPDPLRALAEKAKFSQYTLTAEELRQFDDFLRRGEKTLKKRPWYQQVVYRLVLAMY